MRASQLNWITNFIWGIADDVLRDLHVRGKYRDRASTTRPRSRCDLRARASQQKLRADFETYLDGFSPNIQDILDNFEFRNQIPRLSRADALGTLIEKLTSPDINLSPDPVMNGDGTVRHPGLDNHAEWEKRSVFLHLLVRKLPAPVEEDLSKGILEAIDMDSYRAERRDAMNIRLADEGGEIDPVPDREAATCPNPNWIGCPSLSRSSTTNSGTFSGRTRTGSTVSSQRISRGRWRWTRPSATHQRTPTRRTPGLSTTRHFSA